MVSNSIRFKSTGTVWSFPLVATGSSFFALGVVVVVVVVVMAVEAFLAGSASIFTSSTSCSGLGCVRVNGNSTDKSLEEKIPNLHLFNVKRTFGVQRKRAYPPIDTISLILTRYCTIIPRFSF